LLHEHRPENNHVLATRLSAANSGGLLGSEGIDDDKHLGREERSSLHFENPNGIPFLSPGLRGTSYLG
jgi:hypothetical protein